MKIIFHENFLDPTYADNPAASPGRIEPVVESLGGYSGFEFAPPRPADMLDITRAHDRKYVNEATRDLAHFDMAMLAAGGAIAAAETAAGGEPAFACVRPPGHHASRASAWGYSMSCTVAVALLRLK